MVKLSKKQFAEWLGYNSNDIDDVIQLVNISDSDGVYTMLQDMGKDEMAEIVEAIYFEHGSLKEAINACKKYLGGINIKMIDYAISNENDSAKKNKLINIRGNLLNKKQLNKSETNFVKKYGIIESVDKKIKLNEDNEIKYKGKVITVKFPSGMFEYYSDKEGKFLKFDTLKGAKESINKEPKDIKESVDTKNIKLSEIRQLVRSIIKEGTSKNKLIKENYDNNFEKEIKDMFELLNLDVINGQIIDDNGFYQTQNSEGVRVDFKFESIDDRNTHMEFKINGKKIKGYIRDHKISNHTINQIKDIIK